MSDTSPVLGVDLDDVCADRLAVIRAGLAAEGIPVSGQPSRWDLRDWGVRDHSHFDALHYGAFSHDDGYARMPAVPGAVEALRALHADGFRIRVITGRLWERTVLRRAVADTAAWLDAQELPVDDIAFVTDKTSVHADVYVEDAPHFLRALRAAGRTVIAFDAPYNRMVGGPRARGWQDTLARLRAWRQARQVPGGGAAQDGGAP